MGGMGGMAGGSMLRARRKDINIKPNRRLDRKSSRGMIFENEELRLRTININAEVERGQTDIKKLRRENELLRREITALRSEYELLDRLLRPEQRNTDESDSSCSCNSDCDDRVCQQNNANTICDENHSNQIQANQVKTCLDHAQPPKSCTSSSKIDQPNQTLGSKCEPKRKASPTKSEDGKQSPPSKFDHERLPLPSKLEIRPHVAFEELPSVPEELGSDCRRDQAVWSKSDHGVTRSVSGSNFQTGDNRRDDESPVSLPPLDTNVSPSSSENSCATVFPKAAPDVIVNGNQRVLAERAPPYGFTLPPHALRLPQTNTYQRFEEPTYCNVPLPPENYTSYVSLQNPTGFRYQCPVPLNPSLPFNEGNHFRFVTQAEQHLQQRQRFHPGGNFEELLSDVESTSGAMGNDDEYVKDSIFMCNTRKVIHQKMVHNVTELNCGQNGCCCQCNCRVSGREYSGNDSEPTIVELKNANGQTSYVTEKRLDLTYDYPKTVDIPENSVTPNPVIDEDTEESSDSSKPCKKQTSQTVHTMTEVNSTILLFERKKYSPPQSKGKFSFFSRSQSAPVGDNEEPVYATVKKLPKKLKRLNLTNLENEVAFQLPSAQNIKDRLSPHKDPTNDLNKLTIQELPECSEAKFSARVSTHQDSIDSAQSSSIGFKESEKGHIDKEKAALNPKAKKRKRFSFYFRKRKTKSDNEKKQDTGESSDERTEPANADEKQKETERLFEPPAQSQGTEIKPTETPLKLQNGHCKHKKNKLCNSHESFKCSICLRRPSTLHVCEKKMHRTASNSIERGSCHPKSFLKQDSYQEMTTSHSEHERTNSITSSVHSGCSLTTQKSRKLSAPHADTTIPWCGCWGNSCL